MLGWPPLSPLKSRLLPRCPSHQLLQPITSSSATHAATRLPLCYPGPAVISCWPFEKILSIKLCGKNTSKRQISKKKQNKTKNYCYVDVTVVVLLECFIVSQIFLSLAEKWFPVAENFWIFTSLNKPKTENRTLTNLSVSANSFHFDLKPFVTPGQHQFLCSQWRHHPMTAVACCLQHLPYSHLPRIPIGPANLEVFWVELHFEPETFLDFSDSWALSGYGKQKNNDSDNKVVTRFHSASRKRNPAVSPTALMGFEKWYVVIQQQVIGAAPPTGAATPSKAPVKVKKNNNNKKTEGKCLWARLEGRSKEGRKSQIKVWKLSICPNGTQNKLAFNR